MNNKFARAIIDGVAFMLMLAAISFFILALGAAMGG